MTFMACWALGPAMGLGVALHQVGHHQEEGHALGEMTQMLLHGHVHDDDADDHSHSAVPPSLMPSQLSGESQLGVVATTGVGGSSPPPVECVWRSGSLPDPTSRGPSSPLSLCVLRL